VLVRFVRPIPQIVIYFKNNIFFMWKMKAHGLALAHRAFVGFLALWAFLLGAFFSMWAFLALAHMGQDQTLWAGPN